MSTKTVITDDLPARLGYLRAMAEATQSTPEAFDLTVVMGDFGCALHALEAVAALHVPEVIEGRPPLTVCSRCSGRPKWPCPEVAAISQWMLGKPGCPDHPEGVRG